jgi:hypothetical protein
MAVLATLLALVAAAASGDALPLDEKSRERVITKSARDGIWPFSSERGRITCQVEGGVPVVRYFPETIAEPTDGGGDGWGEILLTSNEQVMWAWVIAAEESFVEGMDPEDMMDALKPFVSAGEQLCAQPATMPDAG